MLLFTDALERELEGFIRWCEGDPLKIGGVPLACPLPRVMVDIVDEELLASIEGLRDMSWKFGTKDVYETRKLTCIP